MQVSIYWVELGGASMNHSRKSTAGSALGWVVVEPQFHTKLHCPLSVSRMQIYIPCMDYGAVVLTCTHEVKQP